MFDLSVTRTKVVRGVPGLVVAALLMGGCVSTGDGASDHLSGAASWVRGVTGGAPAEAEPASPLTPAEQRMRDQSRAFQKTVWEGVLIGASAGAIWGLVKGDDARDVMKKALIGGAAGGLAGA